MKIITACIVLFLSTIAVSSYAQTISADTVLIHATVTDEAGAALTTQVNFENISDHKVITGKTTAAGKVIVTLHTGESYVIKIPGSSDSYEYNIPDFSVSPLEIAFKFNKTAEIEATAGIRIFNKYPALHEISIKSSKGVIQSYNIDLDTLYIPLGTGITYELAIKAVEIKNNLIRPVSETKAAGYILNFRDKAHAELIPVKSDEAIFDIYYTDLYNNPVQNEFIAVKASNTGKEIKVSTTAAGRAFAIVPAQDAYTLSLKYFPNVFEQNIKEQKGIVNSNIVLLKYPSPKQYEEQKRREATMLKKRDSLYLAFEKIKEKNKSDFQQEVIFEADAASKGLQKDPQYFEKEHSEVCAVLNRNRYKWKYKMIVTDVTGSMYPYMRQVALWHYLEFMNKERSDYCFFNDGDNRPDNLKTIGSTGGIYFSFKNLPDSVLGTMMTAMQNGGGGDAPENDIEALIAAVSRKDNISELILIADDLSPVKDITLLSKLKVPVRVVLCGTKSGYVNPDYLEIAYRTKGSIHTIEEDITYLETLHDNDTILISGNLFKFIGGHFFPIVKSI